MKSRKMTNNLRWSIRNKAEQKKFAKEIEALKKEENALAEEIYNAYYEEFLPLMNQLPTGAFNHTSSLRIYTAPESYSYFIDIKAPRPCFNLYTINISDPKIEPFTSRFEQYNKRLEAFDTDRTRYSNVVAQLLHGVSTTQKLVELMPEAAEWLTDGIGECSDIPVADKVAELRAM